MAMVRPEDYVGLPVLYNYDPDKKLGTIEKAWATPQGIECVQKLDNAALKKYGIDIIGGGAEVGVSAGQVSMSAQVGEDYNLTPAAIKPFLRTKTAWDDGGFCRKHGRDHCSDWLCSGPARSSAERFILDLASRYCRLCLLESDRMNMLTPAQRANHKNCATKEARKWLLARGW